MFVSGFQESVAATLPSFITSIAGNEPLPVFGSTLKNV